MVDKVRLRPSLSQCLRVWRSCDGLLAFSSDQAVPASRVTKLIHGAALCSSFRIAGPRCLQSQTSPAPCTPTSSLRASHNMRSHVCSSQTVPTPSFAPPRILCTPISNQPPIALHICRSRRLARALSSANGDSMMRVSRSSHLMPFLICPRTNRANRAIYTLLFWALLGSYAHHLKLNPPPPKKKKIALHTCRSRRLARTL